jgi:hypothetical protein
MLATGGNGSKDSLAVVGGATGSTRPRAGNGGPKITATKRPFAARGKLGPMSLSSRQFRHLLISNS